MMSISSVKVRAHIDTMNEKAPFSGIILVHEKGKPLYEGSYGFANRSELLENRLNTRFGIASGCKIFTAVAIGQLVEKGLLSFNTLLKDCLDIPFKSFSPEVSIAHLLMHNSGIPDYFDEDVMDDYEQLWVSKPMYAMRSPRDFLPLYQDKPMMFQPGERFHYNNAGFITLGLVVEQVTGMPFIEYVKNNVFNPSGMSDTGYFPLDSLPERVAFGYIDNDDGTWRSNIYSIPAVGGPDGGCFTTAPDMMSFWKALLNYQLLREDTTKEMLKCHIKADENIYYGYGVWLHQVQDSYQFFVQGSDPGVNFMSMVCPEQDIQLAVFLNTNRDVWDICDGLISML